MEIDNGTCRYEVGKQVAETEKYRLYLSVDERSGRQCLLQVATATEYNGDLDRAAFILGELARRADDLEKEYERVKADPKVRLNYGLGFPELLDSFICQEQGGRRINILAFRNVDDVSQMIPLTNITEKDRLRVDLRTSAWIMGKLLKLLVFTHSEKIEVGLLLGSNILIEPKQHYVLIFDWSDARMNPEGMARETWCQEISLAAQAVIEVLGGDWETGAFPDDGDDSAFEPYTSHLLRLARGGGSNAERAHEKFYENIDTLWERKYYPFTTKPLA